jgi:hypothetical protein
MRIISAVLPMPASDETTMIGTSSLSSTFANSVISADRSTNCDNRTLAPGAGDPSLEGLSHVWRALLYDLVKRGGRTPELIIADGAPGLEKALAALWPDAPVQRCTVHKHRNLLAHAPERLHEEISNDYRDMIYAATRTEVEARRKVFIRE